MSLTVSRSIGTHESQKPSRSRRLTRRTRTSRRSNKETFTSAPEEEEKDTEGEEVDVRRGERREPRREKREGEDAAPSRRMNGATSDVVRGMCPGEVELPAIVTELIIVYKRGFGIRYRIMTSLYGC